MHDFKTKQIVHFQQPVTLPINQKNSISEENSSEQQCLSSVLKCGSKSKQLKQALNSTNLKNQQSIQIHERKLFKQNANILRLQTSFQNQRSIQHKDNRKGICLTARKDSEDKNFIFQTACQNKDNNLSEQRLFLSNQLKSKIYETQAKTYHRLNPLSIDRKSYDSEVQLGGKRLFDKTRSSLYSVKNLGTQHVLNDRIHNSTIVTNQRVSFNASNTQKFITNNSITIFPQIAQQVRKVRVLPVNFNYKTFQSSEKQIIQRNNLCDFSSILSTQRYVEQYFHKNELNFTSLNKDKNEFKFKDITTGENSPNKKDLFASNFSNHSEKYKNYMLQDLLVQKKQLPKEKQNEINNFRSIDLLSKDQNFDLQHNQKSQNDLQQRKSISQHKPHSLIDKKLRSNFVYSSFTVVESRQKQIQSARNIYDQAIFVGDSINSSKQLKKTTENNTFPKFTQIQDGSQFEGQVQNNQEKLISDNQILLDYLTALKTQEEILYQQSQLLTSGRISKLDQKIKQLSALKFLSAQRSLDLETLKEFIRVKKIQQSLMSNKKMYETYLKDENSWSQYIKFNGNFDELYFSDQTSETLNKDDFVASNSEVYE